MNTEANKKKKEVGTLLTMLTALGKLGVTDSLLQRKYGLNRASLHRVRCGGDLPTAHAHYFKMLLRAMEWQRVLCHEKKDETGLLRLGQIMFEVMLRENGISPAF